MSEKRANETKRARRECPRHVHAAPRRSRSRSRTSTKPGPKKSNAERKRETQAANRFHVVRGLPLERFGSSSNFGSAMLLGFQAVTNCSNVLRFGRCNLVCKRDLQLATSADHSRIGCRAIALEILTLRRLCMSLQSSDSNFTYPAIQRSM